MKTILFTTIIALFSVLSKNTFAENWTSFNTSNSLIPSNLVTAVLSENEGFWIGTDNGLAFYDRTNWTIYDSETSELPDNYIHDIEKDNYGNIWVATNGGILQIKDNGWIVYTTENSGLPSNAVRSVTTDSEGNLWVGTWGGGIASKIGSQWTVYNTSNSDLPSNGVFTVEVDELANVWAGTFNGGVSKFDGQNWTTYDTDNSQIQHNNVRTITFASGGIVWFGTGEGVARKTSNDNWNIYTFVDIGYSFHSVFAGKQTDADGVFFATDGGILHFKQATFNPNQQATFSFTTVGNSNLETNNIRALEIDSDGNFLLGTGYNGLIISSFEEVGISEPKKNEYLLNIYPNPVADGLSFTLPEKETGDMEVTVVDIIGKTVVQRNEFHTNGQQHHLNTEHLASGSYHLIIRSEEGMSTQKFYRL